MARKQVIISERMDRLEEIVKKAGLHLKSSTKETIPHAKASEKPKPKQSKKNSGFADQKAFFEAMEGVERIFWNRAAHISEESQYVPEKNPEIEQRKLMQQAMEQSAPMPITEHPEYIEGWVSIAGRRYLPLLRNGFYSIQGQIDLHGLNQAEARAAVEGYIMRMSRFRPCCIKIIHGRGMNSPANRATLKDRLPRVLSTRKMARYVVAYASSSQLDGGVGSIYVLLKPRNYLT